VSRRLHIVGEAAPAADPQAGSDRPQIDLRAGEMPETIAAAMRALLGGGGGDAAGIFQRGGMLVRVAQLGEASVIAGIARGAGAVIVVPITSAWLGVALSRAATFWKFDARTKKMRRVDPPAALCAGTLALVGEWPFPELVGLIEAPTLRPDGSLLTAPGFDRASGLYAAFVADSFGEINPTPNRADADAALVTLRDLLSEFVFLAREHEAAALAAMIAAGVRHALGTAPAYGFNAPEAGSGKTTLAQAIAQVWTGRDAPAMPLGDDENELRKAILSALIAADPILLIDNVERPIESATLCAVLTSPRFRDRVLGRSEHVTVPTATTWLATGNNLRWVGDLTSRTVQATLDPQVEHPENRTFRRRLPDFIAERRAELVRAALTLPLAYAAAGFPTVSGPPSRFREWDRFVRRPLLWLGCADPLATQAEISAHDERRANLAALLIAWRATFADRPATVADATREAKLDATLLDAIMAVAGDRDGTVNSRRLGRYLLGNARRILGGLRIEDAGEDRLTHRRRFRVTGVSGVSGVSPTLRAEIGSDSFGSMGWTNAKNADNAGGQWDEF
jgi:putative DNA primase/helicase